MSDIFDKIATDVFDSVESEDTSIGNVKSQLVKLLEQFDNKDRKKERTQLKNEFEAMLKREISKIKPIQNVIERKIETKVIEPRPIHIEPKVIQAPPQIIKEVRIEVPIEKKDPKKYVEMSSYLDLLVKFNKLEKALEETSRMAETPIFLGGPGVIGIPPPESNPDGYVLTVSKGKATWKVSTGGSSADSYITSNVTTTTSLDPTTSTIDNLFNVVASLIVSLQGAGIIK